MSVYVINPVSADILWNNGSFINGPGGMTGDVAGADRSFIPADANTFGYGMTGAFSVADDFSLGIASTIDSLTFYGYTTGATAPGATALFARIWDANPSLGGNIIWGDLTTNILSSNSWMAGPSALGVYRTTNADTLGATRRIQEINASGLNISLAAGNYWLEWNVTGVSFTPPLHNPANLNAVLPGNALQLNGTTGAWGGIVTGPAGSTIPVDLGFVVSGTAIPEPGTWSVLALCAAGGVLRRRRR